MSEAHDRQAAGGGFQHRQAVALGEGGHQERGGVPLRTHQPGGREAEGSVTWARTAGQRSSRSMTFSLSQPGARRQEARRRRPVTRGELAPGRQQVIRFFLGSIVPQTRKNGRAGGGEGGGLERGLDPERTDGDRRRPEPSPATLALRSAVPRRPSSPRSPGRGGPSSPSAPGGGRPRRRGRIRDTRSGSGRGRRRPAARPAGRRASRTARACRAADARWEVERVQRQGLGPGRPPRGQPGPPLTLAPLRRPIGGRRAGAAAGAGRPSRAARSR